MSTNWEDRLKDYLAQKGLRVTRQRQRIAEAFFQSDGHPNIDELYEAVRHRDPGIGQATVYRTLKLLVESGLANQSQFGDGTTRYEAAHAEHHDHLICVDCGHIIEFRDDTIESLQDQVAQRHGFEVTDHKMVIYAHCKRVKCPEGEAARKAANPS